jgi:hypothetical protein
VHLIAAVRILQSVNYTKLLARLIILCGESFSFWPLVRELRASLWQASYVEGIISFWLRVRKYSSKARCSTAPAKALSCILLADPFCCFVKMMCVYLPNLCTVSLLTSTLYLFHHSHSTPPLIKGINHGKASWNQNRT